MIRILTITLSVLTLAGCAGGYDKSAAAKGCKPLDHASYTLHFSNDNESSTPLANVPTNYLFSSNKHQPPDISAYKCVPDEDNKGQEPQSGDLQKIGAAHPSGIESRPT